MGVPVFLFLASACGVLLACLLQSPELLMLAGPAALASLWIVFRALLAAVRQPSPAYFYEDLPSDPPKRRPRRIVPRRLQGIKKQIIVDGSNVMHWKDNSAQLATLLEVLRALEARGYSPGVVFDANAGYKLSGSYKHDFAFGRLLGLPRDRVMVVNKGEPADPIVLKAARLHGVRVVSNDRFRDWVTDFPEVAEPAHFLRGGYRDGVLWLQPDAEVVAA
jgi:hypothetical protein